MFFPPSLQNFIYFGPGFFRSFLFPWKQYLKQLVFKLFYHYFLLFLRYSQQLLRQILYYTPLFYKHKAYKHRSLIDRGVEQQGGWGCGIAGWLEKILKTKLSRGREGWVGIVGGWKKLKILIARLCGGVEEGGGEGDF